MEPVALSRAELDARGLLVAGTGCQISPHALFCPTDHRGVTRPITLDGCVIHAGAILHGGTRLGSASRVEAHTIIGVPEHGYALGRHYLGDGDTTRIGAGAVIRAGAILYAGVTVGAQTTIGHHTLLRSLVTVGSDSQLGHGLTIERPARIGRGVRCSPLSHLTSAIVLEDGVFVGAGVATINDKTMVWRQPGHQVRLTAPVIAEGARIGSGATLQAGIRIGRRAMVGAGALVTRDVPDDTLFYGVPAKPHCHHDAHPPAPKAAAS